MKQVMCSQMGGPATCSFAVQANTPEEAVEKMMPHAQQAHPDLAADIAKMAPEDTTKWMEKFRVTFAALPDM